MEFLKTEFSLPGRDCGEISWTSGVLDSAGHIRVSFLAKGTKTLESNCKSVSALFYYRFIFVLFQFAKVNQHE